MSLAGSIGSLPFLPKEVQSSVSYYYQFNGGALVGKYGLYDSFNLEKDFFWVAQDVIGIDKGIALVMVENYRSGLIWECINNADFMDLAIEVLGFQAK